MTAASDQGGEKRFRKPSLNQATQGAYRSRTGVGFRNDRLDQAERRRNGEDAQATTRADGS